MVQRILNRVSGGVTSRGWRGRGEFRMNLFAPPPELKQRFHGISSLMDSGELICSELTSAPRNAEELLLGRACTSVD